ncbi:MAG: nitrous oxide reductase accessory protein NosL [Candidatus Riflebacteria bacterium]|nr:nitrous oxide reductase accessory protein NosL [Candidatus Riflebacteria bacterium]
MLTLYKDVLLLFVAVALVMGSSPVYLTAAEPPARLPSDDICSICGMYIQRFLRTAVYVEYAKGETESYCGVACAVRAINEAGRLDAVETAQVTSWTSRRRVPMKEATYVIGSKLVPDMLPNIIAFGSRAEADSFMARKGGKLRPLSRLLEDTSYRGLTAPFRITPAAVPSAQVLNVAVNYATRRMGGLLRGSHEISQAEGLAAATQVPARMEMTLRTLGIGYGLTDEVFSQLSVPFASRDMTGAKRDGTSQETSTDGFGDATLMTRWRFWHDTDYDRHLGILAGVTLPTGDYRSALRTKANVQEGLGAYAFTPGLLYSHRLGEFWFHAAATYAFNRENSDDYRFGNCFKAGVAAHWLPNSRDLLGLEVDFENTLANEYLGVNQANSGRRAAYASLVYQRRFLLVWGGNLNLNALFGVPLAEDVNGTQLGEKNHGLLGLQWQRKF